MAFPPETQNQRPPRPPTPPPAPPPAEGGDEGAEPPAEGEEAAAEDAEAPAAAEVPAVAEEVPPAAEEAPPPPAAAAAGNFPGGKPLIWLAQYLKARNKQNTRESKEQAFAAAQELAGKEADNLDEHFSNVFGAVRHVLWPCSAYIAQAKTIKRALPPTPEPPKLEGEEGGEEALPEDGEDAPPPKVKEVKYEEVSVLQYVATSHPMGPEAIDGWELEYQTAGVTGQVLTDREPLLVLDVAADPNLHWFARKPTRLMGSYYVAPLIDEDGAVWGVLGVDTLLDGRTLTGEDTEKIAAITSRANPVLCQILANLPPSPEPEEEAAEEAAGDGGEPAEGGEGETA